MSCGLKVCFVTCVSKYKGFKKLFINWCPISDKLKAHTIVNQELAG